MIKLFSFLELLVEEQEGLIVIFYNGKRYEYSIIEVPGKFLILYVQQWECEEYEGSVNMKFWIGEKE